SDEQYVQKPVGVIPSSLGGHIRHCLDHFLTLCGGVHVRHMDYDQRARGTVIEVDRSAAIAALSECKRTVAQLNVALLSMPLRVSAIVACDGAAIEVDSSLGRELAFVLSHTIHHNALIAAMCCTLGIPLPARFGYAPATIAHLDGCVCAPSPSSP